MEKETWKTIAIILLIVLIIENGILYWSVKQVLKDEENLKECYYNVCDVYPEAVYEEGVCTCYDYDMLGEFMVVKTELMK